MLFTFFEDLRSFWGCNLDLSGGRVGFWLQGEKEIRRQMLAGWLKLKWTKPVAWLWICRSCHRVEYLEELIDIYSNTKISVWRLPKQRLWDHPYNPPVSWFCLSELPTRVHIKSKLKLIKLIDNMIGDELDHSSSNPEQSIWWDGLITVWPMNFSLWSLLFHCTLLVIWFTIEVQGGDGALLWQMNEILK